MMGNEFRQVERHVYCTYASVLMQCLYIILTDFTHTIIYTCRLLAMCTRQLSTWHGKGTHSTKYCLVHTTVIGLMLPISFNGNSRNLE